MIFFLNVFSVSIPRLQDFRCGQGKKKEVSLHYKRREDIVAYYSAITHHGFDLTRYNGMNRKIFRDSSRSQLGNSSLLQQWILCTNFTPPAHQTRPHSVPSFFFFLSSGLELCSDEVDVLATFYNLFTNLMDRLGRERCSRTLRLLKHFCRVFRPIIRRTENEMDALQTVQTYFDLIWDVQQSGINW